VAVTLAAAQSSRFKRRDTQCGHALWILLIGVALLVAGAWKYNESRKDAAAAAALASKRAQEQAEKSRVDAERVAMDRRVAAERQQRDSYTRALQQFDDAAGRWDDAVKVANTTSRIALSGPVAKLQELHRDAEKLTAPPCLDEGKLALVNSMDHTVNGFLIFMRNELKIGDSLARSDFEQAARDMQAYKDQRAACPATV
jgi:hypothetical protein